MYNNHRLRPLRNNYRGRLIGKRNEDEPPDGRRRSMRSMRRISLLATPASSSSCTDEEDEVIHYTQRSRRMLPRKRNLEVAETSTRSRSKRLSVANSTKQEADGIRRSTRNRKLKFENVNDSWILGAQALKGYPNFPGHFSKKDSDEDDENEREDDDDEEEEEEEEEMEAEDEEPKQSQNEEENGEVQPHKRRASLRMRPRRRNQTDVRREPIMEDNEEEESNGSEEGENETREQADDAFEDMYARVKQRRQRRQTSSYMSTDRSVVELRSRLSDSMSSDDEQPQPRRTRRRQISRRTETQGDDKVQKYSLRQKKPTVQRFQIVEAPPNPFREVLISRRKKRRRRAASSSSSSTSSDDRDRDRRDRREKRRLELVGDSKNDTGKLTADTGLMTLDQSIRFSNIGGLESHINSLKEMILFPILYPEIFTKFGVTPPKGVLFHGPPGTGKTLMARALANECSQGNRKVSFFMRKGADVLSKWVGESERQLRLLFQEAHQGRPSIIFFDELDGLAPVRSSKQDQIHSSIVCTLLALMDGLDNRGDIIIIGATNRIDSIDPALRRPGRFDRELHFPLPGVKERRDILQIHAPWADPDILNKMAEVSAGYCGSDLKALCTESVIHSLKRVYPQIYTSNRKLLLNNEKVKVEKVDFERALRKIVPSAQRSWAALGRKMPPYLDPILGGPLAALLSYVGDVFLLALNRRIGSQQVSRSPRLLLVGDHKATSVLSSSLLYKLENCPVLNVAFDTLYTEPGRSPEEVLKQIFKELPHRSGCILWFGNVSLWWNNTSLTVRATFESLVSQIDPSLPILYLGTSKEEKLPHQVKSLFKKNLNEVYVVPDATKEQREAFFRPLFRIKALRPPPKPKPKKEEIEPLEEAPPTPPPKLTEEQLEALHQEEENTLRELRIFLRQICAKLARNKAFYMFSKPVDVNEVPDYLQVIKEPMDLETMMTKIDHLEYTCAQDFLKDVDLLCTNALEYNPDRDPADKQIRHRACHLRDTAYALIKAEMDSDFEINCRQIRDERKKRSTSKDASDQPSIKDEPSNAKNEKNETEARVSADGKSMEESKNSNTTPMNSTSPQRKRRRCMWQKGIMKKKRKQSDEGPSSSAGGSTKADGVGDPVSHSTPSKRLSGESRVSSKVGSVDRLNDSVAASEDARNETLNGYITGATEESADELMDTPKKVIVDREALNRLLHDTVESTSRKNNPERLIDLHGSFVRVIDSYSLKWDRTQLVHDLRYELRKFAEENTSEDDSP